MKVLLLGVVQCLFLVSLIGAVEVPEALVNGLSAEVFKDREKSQAELLSWGKKGGKDETSSIYRLFKATEDPEVAQRCLKVLKALSDQDYLSEGQGYLGIQMFEEMVNLEGEENELACIRITRVVADSPADEAGLRVGDLIVELDGKRWDGIGAINQFMVQIADTKPLKTVALTVKRREEDLKSIEVVLGKRPIENLSGINQDLKLLDQRAREEHFEKWLKRQNKEQ